MVAQVYIRKHYVNFHMRKLIKAFILSNAEFLIGMDITEQAEFIAKGVETMVCLNYWVKDKRRVQQLNQAKAA